jgi:putative addiction module killer protein
VVKTVGDGVSELKIDFGPGYRVYFGSIGTEIVILLGGGDKGSQSKDIKAAQKLLRELKESE